jgi:hypothetical protein
MSAMTTEQTRTVSVRLDAVDDLFVDPDPGAERYVSGIEELYRAIKVHTRVLKRPDKYQVTVELPLEKITDGLADEMGLKIKRYCQFKAEESHQSLMVLRHQGLDSVWVSVVALIPCLILGAIYLWLSQRGINSVLEAVFLVVTLAVILSVGWVALWMPAETLLYDTWPFQQDMRVYQQLAEAELVISERPEKSSS